MMNKFQKLMTQMILDLKTQLEPTPMMIKLEKVQQNIVLSNFQCQDLMMAMMMA